MRTYTPGRVTSWAAVTACLFAFASCERSTQSGGSGAAQPGTVGALAVTSPAFGDGQAIPARFTEDGLDLSPELRWTGVPAQARQLALLVDDPDAPTTAPWVHWVLYAMPASTTGLPEAVAKDETLTAPAGAKQGKNSWGTIGYRGPAPPPGKLHHYHFAVYALDAELPAPPGLDKAALLQQLEGHILAKGELVGTYQR